MSAHRLFSAILQVILICALAYIGDGWRYDGIGVAPGPTVTPTRGQVWPKPLKRTESDNYLVVRASLFNFKVTGHDCDLLQEAFSRYYSILSTASRRRPSRSGRNKPWRRDVNFVGFLESLKVELSSPCESRPHAGMSESYDLHISKDGSWLSSKSVWGILRGLETFVQTVVPSPDGSALIVKESETSDSPRYAHRGLLLDTSRHYLPVRSILRTLDAMEASKLNVFHWHIVDDQAFPYQSARFPELRRSNPDINDFMNANNLTGDYAGLEEYYVQKLVDMVKQFNISNIVWQEVFDNGVRIEPDTVVQVWIPRDSQKEMSRVTAKGYRVLLSSCWYLDSLSSGGDWQKFYECDPENFPGTAEQKELVLGGETCMWGEVVDWTNLESRVWPRACAAAEKLWTSPDAFQHTARSTIHRSDWYERSRLSNYDISEVAARLEEHRCRLLQRGIQAQPPNGAGFCPGERW
ncbi:hypothetical protein J437_LFUL003460 [Ladona fulva]|uniref:beta-N-acetylhexosaminidase n=1 Tax=Ladona fulva TaxID=123851 RepID=A0A8K0NTZ2_LADFU|nr:hypothetical protein J437_LFUL003460 [Ladona fulva]